MNERIKKLTEQAGFSFKYKTAPDELNPGHKLQDLEKFAELIVAECTQLLFAESERLYSYSSECDNVRHSDEAELCAEKCIDNIAMIEKHFGVEE